MTVKMLDPTQQNAFYQKELEKAALSVIRSGQFILGETVEVFEGCMSSLLTGAYTVGVSSGTDALLVALMALDVGPGDEVICPSFTFFATAGSVARVGATPVFIDIDEDTFNMDVSLLEGLVTDKTKAIIPVHLFGQCADMPEVLRVAQKYNLRVIEDVAQAQGAHFGTHPAGTMGDIGCFSFFPSKNLGGFGDAGMVCTRSEELYEKMKSIRNHGMTATYHHTMMGGNFRIDALQAALLTEKLPGIDFEIQNRIGNAANYANHLPSSCKAPAAEIGVHTYNQYTILVPEGTRDKVAEGLRARDIGFGVYYPKGLHEQPCFAELNTGSLPVTEAVSQRCLSLPIAPPNGLDEVMEVCSALDEILS